MMASALSDTQDSTTGPPLGFTAVMASLRQGGADKFDPVHLHFLEVLAQRGNVQQGRVKSLLDARLAKALAAFKARFVQAQAAAKDAVDRTTSHHPQVGADLQRLLQAGDFRGVTQFIADLERTAQRSPLRELAHHLAPGAAHSAQVSLGFDEPLAQPLELKTSRVFRNTWSKLSVDRQLTRALDQAPKNAGPINSHMLVLRSLALMRDLSPDYLNRFTSYAETLLCLDSGGAAKSGKPQPLAPGAAPERAKPRRAKPKLPKAG